MALRRAIAAGRDRGRPPMRPAGVFEPLITAEEVYPALAKLAWAAERTIWMAFRIFEPGTRIRGPDVPAETWLDLLREKLRQGVEVRIALADFDPIVAPEPARDDLAGRRGAGDDCRRGSLEVLPIRHEARDRHAVCAMASGCRR